MLNEEVEVPPELFNNLRITKQLSELLVVFGFIQEVLSLPNKFSMAFSYQLQHLLEVFISQWRIQVQSFDWLGFFYYALELGNLRCLVLVVTVEYRPIQWINYFELCVELLLEFLEGLVL